MRRLSVALQPRHVTARCASYVAGPTTTLWTTAKPPPTTAGAPAQKPQTPSSGSAPDPFDPESIAAEFKVDAKAAEQMRVAQAIGEDAFEENTTILKQLAMRGLRAFLVAAVGLGTFGIVMKRKKRRDEAEKGDASDADKNESAKSTDAAAASQPAVVDSDDPTQRYLEEMRGLGFDVDTLEEELATEKANSVQKQRKKAS